MSNEVSKQLDIVEKGLQRLNVKKDILVRQGLESSNPNDFVKATNIVNQLNLQQRNNENKKSFLIDPNEFSSNFKYKDRHIGISYRMLSSMARTPIINAIIKTRLNQVAAFSEPQKDEYSVGFKIQLKQTPGLDESRKLTKDEVSEIKQLMEFIENCGDGNVWGNDDFDTFVRKFMRDSIIYDQATFEIVRDAWGKPVEFFATDASTKRVAHSYDDDEYEKYYSKKRVEIAGYYPSYVQIYDNQVINEYYPWELCFGIRNPTTSIHNQGYGVSELEELVTIITGILWAEQYNRNFFKQGSAPKGIFRVKGNMNDSHLQQFRQQWNAQMRGVANSWKTPFLQADSVEYHDLQKSNRDMEYEKWVEFLIKTACAVFSIDPSEVNFDLKGSSGGSPMFEGSNEGRLKHSKDKGLYPLLKFLQKRMNKFIISHFYNGKYELVFVGLDSTSRKETAELELQAVKTYKTVNELREEKGMPPVEGGDILLDPTFASSVANKQMEEEQSSLDYQEDEDYDFASADDDVNPFEKGLGKYLSKL